MSLRLFQRFAGFFVRLARLGLAFSFNGACFVGGVFSIRFRTSSRTLSRGFVMVLYPTWVRLPTQYNAAIGRIVSRQAVLEDNLHKVICALLEVSLPYGRIAVPCPRAKDAIIRIEDLMQLRGFSTTVNLQGLQTDCKALEEFRDKLAHGTWAKVPGFKTPILQITTGKNNAGVKARIAPKGGRVTLETMNSYVAGIDNAIRGISKLTKELKPQHDALLRKRSAQSRRS